jgi:hypothetical protein
VPPQQGEKSDTEIILDADDRLKELLKGEDERFQVIFRQHAWKKWEFASGARNRWIVDRVPFLLCVGGKGFVRKCSRLMHRAAGIFEASLSEHLEKTEAMIHNVTISMIGSLSSAERKVYERLDERRREAFLVLRDCALHSLPDPFPMSCKELRVRLDLADNSAASRILNDFTFFRITTVAKLGETYQTGQRPRATTYRWILSELSRPVPNSQAA